MCVWEGKEKGRSSTSSG